MEVDLQNNCLPREKKKILNSDIVFYFRFVRIKVRNEPGVDETTSDGIPLWPLIYYSLRCGDISAAIQAVEQSGFVI